MLLERLANLEDIQSSDNNVTCNSSVKNLTDELRSLVVIKEETPLNDEIPDMNAHFGAEVNEVVCQTQGVTIHEETEESIDANYQTAEVTCVDDTCSNLSTTSENLSTQIEDKEKIKVEFDRKRYMQNELNNYQFTCLKLGK